MMTTPSEPIARFTVDDLRVLVFENREQAGQAASANVAAVMLERQRDGGRVNVVFAAAPSQNEFLNGLAAAQGIDWSRVVGFHMDEYLGLTDEHPASFRRYLQEHLFQQVGLNGDRLNLIPGEQTERPLLACADYEELLLKNPTDVVCAGIGENGHLAFNDPPVADFLDPNLVKVVRLDLACRTQQVNDGCFAKLDDVPTHAFTLTVPALLRASTLAVIVPGPRKAEAVLATLKGPIGEACPATALRKHPGATLYLDRESARLIL